MASTLRSNRPKDPVELHREMYEKRRRERQLTPPARPQAKPPQRGHRSPEHPER